MVFGLTWSLERVATILLFFYLLFCMFFGAVALHREVNETLHTFLFASLIAVGFCFGSRNDYDAPSELVSVAIPEKMAINKSQQVRIQAYRDAASHLPDGAYAALKIKPIYDDENFKVLSLSSDVQTLDKDRATVWAFELRPSRVGRLQFGILPTLITREGANDVVQDLPKVSRRIEVVYGGILALLEAKKKFLVGAFWGAITMLSLKPIEDWLFGP